VPAGYRELRQVFTDINPVSVAVAEEVPRPAPLIRVEYVSTGADELWFQCVVLLAAGEGVGNFCQAPAGNHPHARVEHGWLRAPLRTTAAAFRTPTTLLIGANDLVDDGPHSGSIARHVLTRTFQLHRDGVLIAEGTDPLGAHAVPADSAVFQLTRTVELRPDLPPLSTVVSSTWTFTSDPPRREQESTVAPLLDVAVHLPVDEWNRVDPSVPLAVEVDVSHAARPAPRVTAVSLEVSTDDGATWQAVELRRAGGDRYRATVPAGALPSAGALSLRTAAIDADGNHTEQTILRACLVGAPASTAG
jgi:hypothetical protein